MPSQPLWAGAVQQHRVTVQTDGVHTQGVKHLVRFPATKRANDSPLAYLVRAELQRLAQHGDSSSTGVGPPDHAGHGLNSTCRHQVGRALISLNIPSTCQNSITQSQTM